MMEHIKMHLQKLKDLQAKKHQKFLEARHKVNKYQQDSYKLLWQIEQVKEKLLATK